MNLSLKEPPVPGSLEELEDLQKVLLQFENRVVPESLQERCDNDSTGMVIEYLQNRNENPNIEELKKLKQHLVPLIKDLKGYFMRDRPDELAKELNIDFECDFLSSAQTPSYPSGHTIQAFVLADYCSRIYPEHSKGLFMIAELVSQSRIDRGVHFPSDVDYGRILAKEISDYLFGQ